jgi:Leucine-rich repeat (LRR) protein
VIEVSGQDEEFGPTIPSEIGNCTALEGIYFSHNAGFTGSIPPTVGNLTNLKHFYMSSNNLTGDMPQSISNLTRLTYINVGSSGHPKSHGENALTGELPDFSNMQNLHGIEVSSNELTGDLHQYWNNGNYTELIYYAMSWNNFTGTVHGFDNLPSIRSILLTGNNLTGGVDWLTTIDHGVKIIEASWNNFSGNFPQNWGGIYWDLRLFDVRENSISGHIPCDFWDSIGGSDNLKWVYLNNNEFDSNATSCMEKVSSPKLQTINVSGNNF